MNLLPDLLEFLKTRVDMTKWQIACELSDLASHGAPWPRASASQWKTAIDKAIADGDLIQVGDYIKLPPPVEEKPVQMGLF